MGTETNLSIIQAACVEIGATPPTSLKDVSAETVAANALYEQQIRFELTRYRWHFATTMYPLGSPLADTPIARWSYAYSLPNTQGEVLQVHGAFRSDSPISFDRYGDKLLCNEEADVTIDATVRRDESLWPPHFVVYIRSRLAEKFAGNITHDAQMANKCMRDCDGEAGNPRKPGLLAEAKRIDAQQQTARRIQTGRNLVGVRRGGGLTAVRAG